MSGNLRFCLVALLLIAAIGVAYAEPVTLEYKFRKGEVDKYRLGVEMRLDLSGIAAATGQRNMPPMDIAMGMTVVQKTLDVYSDGSAKVKVTYSNPVFKGINMPAAASKQAKALQGQPVVMRISKRGRTMSIQGLEKIMGSGMPFNLNGIMDASSGNAVLPQGPVEVGQSWMENIPLPFGDSQIYVQSVLAGYDEEIWNLRVARVCQSCSGKLDLKAMLETFMRSMASSCRQQAPDLSSMSGELLVNGQMTNYFAPSIGKLLKSGGNLDAVINIVMPQSLTQQGAPQSLSCAINIRMAMTRFN